MAAPASPTSRKIEASFADLSELTAPSHNKQINADVPSGLLHIDVPYVEADALPSPPADVLPGRPADAPSGPLAPLRTSNSLNKEIDADVLPGLLHNDVLSHVTADALPSPPADALPGRPADALPGSDVFPPAAPMRTELNNDNIADALSGLDADALSGLDLDTLVPPSDDSFNFASVDKQLKQLSYLKKQMAALEKNIKHSRALPTSRVSPSSPTANNTVPIASNGVDYSLPSSYGTNNNVQIGINNVNNVYHVPFDGSRETDATAVHHSFAPRTEHNTFHMPFNNGKDTPESETLSPADFKDMIDFLNTLDDNNSFTHARPPGNNVDHFDPPTHARKRSKASSTIKVHIFNTPLPRDARFSHNYKLLQQFDTMLEKQNHDREYMRALLYDDHGQHQLFMLTSDNDVIGGLTATLTNKHGSHQNGQHFYFVDTICISDNIDNRIMGFHETDTRLIAEQYLFDAVVNKAHEHPLKPRIVIETSTDSINRVVKAIIKDDKFFLTWMAPLPIAMSNTIAESLPPQFNATKQHNRYNKSTLIFSSNDNAAILKEKTIDSFHPNFTRNIYGKASTGKFIDIPAHAHIGRGIYDYGLRSLFLSVYAHATSGAINAIITNDHGHHRAPDPDRANFDAHVMKYLSRRTRSHDKTSHLKSGFGLQDRIKHESMMALRFAPYKFKP